MDNPSYLKGFVSARPRFLCGLGGRLGQLPIFMLDCRLGGMTLGVWVLAQNQSGSSPRRGVSVLPQATAANCAAPAWRRAERCDFPGEVAAGHVWPLGGREVPRLSCMFGATCLGAAAAREKMMLAVVRMLAGVALLCGFASARLASAAQESQLVRVTSGVQYQLLERWDIDRLNQILQAEMPKFSGISVVQSGTQLGAALPRHLLLSDPGARQQADCGYRPSCDP